MLLRMHRPRAPLFNRMVSGNSICVKAFRTAAPRFVLQNSKAPSPDDSGLASDDPSDYVLHCKTGKMGPVAASNHNRYVVKSLVHATQVLHAFAGPGDVLRLRDVVAR